MSPPLPRSRSDCSGSLSIIRASSTSWPMWATALSAAIFLASVIALLASVRLPSVLRSRMFGSVGGRAGRA